MTQLNEMPPRRAVRSIAFVTMGCAKNEVDTEHMRKRVCAAGYSVTENPEEASAIVVNTCSFIQAATEESIEAVFDAAGLENVEAGRAALIVAGCMPARYGDDLAEELSEASAFLPCAEEDDIVSVLDREIGKLHLSPEEETFPSEGAHASHDAPSLLVSVAPSHAEAQIASGGKSVSFDTTSQGESASQSEGASQAGGAFVKTFAYVKISDGCDRFCSYCTIPYIRGRYHSFSYADIRAEVSEHVRAGVREIVLIAQDTGRWGKDFPEPSTLAQLVADLAEEFHSTWFRVMYIQPEGITDEMLDAVESHGNICSYFDIPIQHVDESILRAMNRKGSLSEFEQLVEHIREKVTNVCLRTTLIAGFPGETDEQFENLCSFVEKGLFDYVGVFPYSREEGTRAYSLPEQLDEETKAERAQTLRDVADASCTPAIAERIGRVEQVLVEGYEEDGQVVGRAMCQAPEVDGATYLDKGHAGEIVSARIVDALMYEMEGEVL